MKFSDIFPWNWGKEKKKARVATPTIQNGPGVYSPPRSDKINRDNWTRIGSKDPSYSNSIGYRDNRGYTPSTTTYNDPVLDPLSPLNPINMAAAAASIVDTAPSEVQPNHDHRGHESDSSSGSSYSSSHSHDHSSSSSYDTSSSSSSDWSSGSSSSDFSTGSSDSGSSSFSTGGDF